MLVAAVDAVEAGFAKGAKLVIVRCIEATRSFPADVSSAGNARAFVRATLEEWQADRFLDGALLAVSELVTNAVLHARSGPEVVVRWAEGRLRIEVHDASSVSPSRKRYGPEAGTGRGLLLVEAISAAWGCDEERGGKSVWFEIDEAHADVTAAVAFGDESLADLADLADLAGDMATSGEGGGPGGAVLRRRARTRPSGTRPSRTRLRGAAR